MKSLLICISATILSIMISISISSMKMDVNYMLLKSQWECVKSIKGECVRYNNFIKNEESK